MSFDDLINDYRKNNSITDEQLFAIVFELRKEVVINFRNNPDRNFALSLLEKLIEKRENQDEIGSAENIMLSCYLLGLCGNINDALLIWRAKGTDFDAFCVIDIQLVVFGGVEQTINLFKSLNTTEATEAIDYISQCLEAGDFDELENYFSPNDYPWWI